MICEAPFDSKGDKLCPVCTQKSRYYNCGMLKRPHDAYQSAHALFFYDENIKRLIYDIKIRQNTEPLFTLARMMVKKLEGIDFDYVTYVPAAPLKRIIKGFNPAKVLAEEASRLTGKVCLRLLSRKQRFFSPEIKRLDAIRRFEHIIDEYCGVYDPLIRNKKILLIDDIMTTGSTLNRCSGLLMENGASGVIVCVIASGRKN